MESVLALIPVVAVIGLMLIIVLAQRLAHSALLPEDRESRMLHRISPLIIPLFRISPFAIAAAIIVFALLFSGTSAFAQQATPEPTSTPTATATPGDMPSAKLRGIWFHSPWSQTVGRPIFVQVSLNWDTPDGYGITNYVVQMYEPNGDEFDPPLTGVATFGDTQIVSSNHSLQVDTNYRYVLTLRNAANETIVEEAITVIVDSTAENPATAAPTNLTASLASDGSKVVLSWDAPEGNLWRYEVIRDWRYKGSVAATQNYVVDKSHTTYTDTNVGSSAGRTYEYRVRAVTGFYTSYDSEVVSIQIPSSTPLSTDATLSALALSGIDFGTFGAGTTSYTAQVANSVSETTVSPTVNHSEASYVIKLGGVADSDGLIPLSVGSNIITIEVTAEDDSTTQTYTLTITRAASTDATLKSLTLSGIDFGTFASGTTTYTAEVANSVSQTTVTPSVNHAEASYVIKLDGVEDADGVISLAAGKNVITIGVSAEDGRTTLTYTVTVTRLVALQQTSTDATLSALALSGINFGTFASGTTSYSASVANSVSQTTVTPTVNDSGASYVIELGGVVDADGVIALSVGSNVITVEVTAEDGETARTYTITVTRAATPISAPDLVVSFAYIFTSLFHYSPSFTLGVTVENKGSGSSGSTTLRYYRSAASTITSGDAEVGTGAVGGLAASGRSIETIDLIAPSAPGTYYYGACVDAVSDESDATNNCSGSVAFTVPAETSTDATLSALTLSDVDFGTFASDTTTYTADVANSVSQTTVRPTVNDYYARYVIKLDGVTDNDGVIALSVGSNVITVEVTAEDDSTTKTYTVTVTRAAPLSSDATLKALSLSGVSIGTFKSVTTSYSAQVANSVSETTVTPTVNHSEASYVIKLGGVTDSDGTVPLSVGRNIVTIEVTAEDDETSQTYTVTVTRAEPPSTDATLSSLTLSGIDFGTFSSSTESYTASVASSVSQTTVTLTVNDSGASYVVKLGGVTDGDGTLSLSVGRNVITIEVTAEDTTTTRTYTFTVTRAEPPSTDATLKALTLSGIDFGSFDSTTISYTSSVANSVSQTRVTATVNDSGASYVIKLGGTTDSDGTVALDVGENVITIKVTAEDDSTTKTYTVTVTRAEPPSTDATLKALTLSGIDFGNFSSTTTSYTASVENGVSVTTVTPTVNDSGARYVIKLGGVTDSDGVVALDVGENVITVEVTAENDSTTKTYTVTVTRAAPVTPEQKSSDASLSSLTLSGVNFGTFDSTTSSYTARVANSVSQTTVTPTVNHSEAIYVIKLGGVTDSDGTVSLAVGRNIIAVQVTAEDGESTRTYTVTVTRSAPPSTDATLSALTFSGVNFGTFAPGTTSYTASVSNGVTQTSVTATANHSGASYVVKLEGVNDSDGTVSLSVGSNVITVVVTAQDANATRTYTVIVTRAAPLSTDATLSGLTLSRVNFGTFDSSTTSYSAQVANSVSSTTVTPSVSSSGASRVIKLGGVTDSDGTVSLSVGSNVITVEVTAQDGLATRTYTVTVTRASQDETPPRSDAPVTGELPTDDPKVNFRVSGYAHDRVDIEWAVPRDRDITRYIVQRYEHDGDGFVSPGSETGARFEGTTEDGEGSSVRDTHVQPDTLYQYVLRLKNDGGTTIIESSATVRTLSSDATLSALTLSEIDFGAFDSETVSYNAEVASDVAQTTVTPSLNHSGAGYVVELDGVADEDGVIDLAVGENVITIVVTAEDGATRETYTVTVARAEQPLLVGELASDDPPVNFRITGYGEDEVSLAWEIPNNRGITSYALARYDHDGTEFVMSDWSVSGTVAGGGSVTESSVGLTSDALYKYDFVLMSDNGTTIIEESFEVRTLATDTTALSADAALSALSLSGVDLVTGFVSSTYRYTGRVANDVTQTSVTATLNDTAAGYVVKLGGAVDVDRVIDLTPGRNVITVHVTAEDGVTTRIYTVVVTRSKVADALSSDATLRALSLSGIDFGTFDSDTTSYAADVANDVTQTAVTPVRNGGEAAHAIKVDGVEDTDGVIGLAVGANVIAVEVTAEDGEATRTYTVTVTRAEAPAPEPTPDPDPEPADTCVQPVGADGAITGSWDDACLSEKDAPGGTGDRYARFYTFTLDEAADIVINLSSDEDTYLYLLNGHGKGGATLHSNDDIAGGGLNLNSRLSVTLQPGDYTIEATTYKPATSGSFALTIAGLGEAEVPVPDPQPEPEPVPEIDTCIESVDGDGTIEEGWDDSCLSAKAALSGVGDRYARFYTFTLNEAADVTITLESYEDTYLYVLQSHGRDGETLHSNDDIVYGVNTNSRLSENLDAGNYTIEATTYYAQTEGDFTLTIEGLGSFP